MEKNNKTKKNTEKMKIIAYVLCSFCAGIAGILFAFELDSVQPAQTGEFYELYAIAAAVLGGCSLRGGEGSILGVVIAAAVIRLIYNSINMVGISTHLEFGILGMVIAITVTFLSTGNFSTGFIFVIIFILLGGSIGAFIAYRIPMTAMPELVAGFHSLVGLAAVFVAISAFLNPEAFNLGVPGNIKLGSLIEMSIGAAVGAITFSGSIIAFLKLQGIMSGSPLTLSLIHI